ncbi:MAG TPA: nucleotide-binding protein [Azonexus sp.]|nr:nucleotide-binding protein [Azonexus sp.]
MTAHLYVSYARLDENAVRSFLEPLKNELKKLAVPVDIWQDVDQLQPGVSWHGAIRDALANSIGLLVFVSPTAMSSNWVQSELAAMLALSDRLIVPIILEHTGDLPQSLRERQWLDLSSSLNDSEKLRIEARKLADAIAKALPTLAPGPVLTENMAEQVAEFAANSVRQAASPPPTTISTPIAPSIFVVHGHDMESRDLVCAELKSIGIEPVILSQQLGQAQSLLQKFLKISERANFAVVVLSADDYGASLIQYDAPGVADRALRFRARQNVLLELGFFYGRLGWENVFVLQRRPPKVFPDFEHPSDLAGAVFDEIDDAGLWRGTLAEKLRSVGFLINVD